MSIRIVNSLPEETWRQFVSQFSDGNIFHTPEIYEVFSKTKGYHPSLWMATDHNHYPLALILPVEIFLNNGYLRYLTTRTVVYGSVLWVPNEAGRRALRELLQVYIQEASGVSFFTEFRNICDLETVQPILNEKGFAYEDHLNYLMDLSPPTEVVFQNMAKRMQKNIRRALGRGEVIIEEVTKRDQIVEWYNVLKQTYSLAKVPLADFSLFEAAFDILYPKGMVRYTLARVGRVVAAVSAELLYKDVIFGWYGGMDRMYSRYIPNELLMWHILEWGVQNGFRVYDFGGAGKPSEPYGVRDFKAKFGGKLVNFGRNVYVHRPIALRLAKGFYEVFRRWL